MPIIWMNHQFSYKDGFFHLPCTNRTYNEIVCIHHLQDNTFVVFLNHLI